MSDHNDTEVKNLLAEIREWLCEKCRIVYPGPLSEGFNCVICPKCGGICGPMQTVLLREAKEQFNCVVGRLTFIDYLLSNATVDLAQAALKELLAEVTKDKAVSTYMSKLLQEQMWKSTFTHEYDALVKREELAKTQNERNIK